MRFRENHPNVIVFLTDQQRHDSTGIHGNPLDLTPNFDRMAQRGTHVCNSFVAQPLCAPSRSVLQTGMYATKSGVFRNGITLKPETKTLAHYFKEAGYATGYIGKWHLASKDPTPRAEQGGYDYWLGANALEFSSHPYDTVVYDADGKEVFLPGYRVDALTDAAIRYVGQHRNDQFFLFLSFLEPHHQNDLDDFPPPDGYRERYTGRWTPPDLQGHLGSPPQHLGGYWGMVKRLDEALGRMIDALKSMGLSDDTVILFSSDHACHFKTRNGEYKRSCHEDSIRVPTALTGGPFTGGGCIRQLVSHVDLAPTLLSAAGINVPDVMQGKTITPLLGGKKAEWGDDVFIQISESQVGRAVRTGRWKYGVDAPGKQPGRDMYSDRYVEQYLYDLECDPYELTNLVGLRSHAELAAVLRDRLLTRMKAAGEPPAIIDPAPPKVGGQRRVPQADLHA
ncbi:MAG TPA: sulfatase-like hydrolase/transferase [Tepidisphaeraceae bacterium]|jgi:arylsulfatase A-like enzyme